MPVNDNFERYQALSTNQTILKFQLPATSTSGIKKGDLVSTNPDAWGVANYAYEPAYKATISNEDIFVSNFDTDRAFSRIVYDVNATYWMTEINPLYANPPGQSGVITDIVRPLFQPNNPFGIYDYAHDADFDFMTNGNIALAYRVGLFNQAYTGNIIYGILSPNGRFIKPLTNSNLNAYTSSNNAAGTMIKALASGGFIIIGRSTSTYDNDLKVNVNGHPILFFNSSGTVIGSNTVGKSCPYISVGSETQQIKAIALPNGNVFILNSDLVNGYSTLSYSIFTGSGATVVKNQTIYTSAANTGVIPSITAKLSYNGDYVGVAGFVNTNSAIYASVAVTGGISYTSTILGNATVAGYDNIKLCAANDNSIIMAIANNIDILIYKFNANSYISNYTATGVTSSSTLANPVTANNYGTLLHSFDAKNYDSIDSVSVNALTFTYRNTSDGVYYVGLIAFDNAFNIYCRYDNSGATYNGLNTIYKTISMPFPMRINVINATYWKDTSQTTALYVEIPNLSGGSYTQSGYSTGCRNTGKFIVWVFPLTSANFYSVPSYIYYTRTSYVPGKLKFKSHTNSDNRHYMTFKYTDTPILYGLSIGDDITTFNQLGIASMKPPILKAYAANPRRVPRGVALNDASAGQYVYVAQSGTLKINSISKKRFVVNTLGCAIPGANFIISGDTITFINPATASAYAQTNYL